MDTWLRTVAIGCPELHEIYEMLLVRNTIRGILFLLEERYGRERTD